MSSYDYEDDECDSSFMYRQRQAIRANNENLQQKEIINKSEIEKSNEIEEEEDVQPLNLSLKPHGRSDDRIQFKSTIYTASNFNNKTSEIATKESSSLENHKKIENIKPPRSNYLKEIKNEVKEQDKKILNETIDLSKHTKIEKDDDSDNDLTDLSWLTNYNLSRDLNLVNFGYNSESEPECDDEADGGSKPLTSFIPASLLQSMLLNHTKPPYSYSCLMFMAIESSPKKRLTVKEIYSWVLNSFSYFRNIPSGSWKNSIRHNLSHNKCFKKVDKNLLASRDFSGKGSLWCVNPESRLVLIEALKKMPQKAYSILQDVPESLGFQSYRTTSSRSPKNMPKITHVSANIMQRQNEVAAKEIKVTDFYKKACDELSDDCSDFDAANALLMIKSANEAKSSINTEKLPKKRSPIKINQIIINSKAQQEATTTLKKRNLSGNKKLKASSLTPCPNDDHTYSNAVKRQQDSNETNSPKRRKSRKKSEPTKVEHVEEINNMSDSYSMNSDSEYYCDSDENTQSTNGSLRTNRSNSSDTSTDRISTVSADTLRNALLELSRAAELIEDKEEDDPEGETNEGKDKTK